MGKEKSTMVELAVLTVAPVLAVTTSLSTFVGCLLLIAGALHESYYEILGGAILMMFGMMIFNKITKIAAGNVQDQTTTLHSLLESIKTATAKDRLGRKTK